MTGCSHCKQTNILNKDKQAQESPIPPSPSTWIYGFKRSLCNPIPTLYLSSNAVSVKMIMRLSPLGFYGNPYLHPKEWCSWKRRGVTTERGERGEEEEEEEEEEVASLLLMRALSGLNLFLAVPRRGQGPFIDNTALTHTGETAAPHKNLQERGDGWFGAGCTLKIRRPGWRNMIVLHSLESLSTQTKAPH